MKTKTQYPKKRSSQRRLSDGSAYATQMVKPTPPTPTSTLADKRIAVRKKKLGGIGGKALENVTVSLFTSDAWKDLGIAVLGGLGHVIVPTAIEAIFRTDLTGWRGYVTSIGINQLAGALMRSPAYQAGAFAAAGAQLLYARGQDWFIKPIFRKWAFRFDPMVTTSSMSDETQTNAQLPTSTTPPLGTTTRTIAGESLQLYPPSPNAANVTLQQPQQYQTSTSQPAMVADNYGKLNDNYGKLNDNYGKLNDNYGKLNDNYATLNDNFTTLNDQSFGANW